MIDKDRALLKRLANITKNVPNTVLDLCANQDGGELPADRLRALGDQLMGLGIDMVARADELDKLVIDSDGGDDAWTA